MQLQRVWLERGAVARLLWPLSRCFGLLAALRRALYRAGWLHTERAGVPVVVVGNVVAGGAGKTPVVMAIVEHLRARGVRAGVISRGHGRRTTDCREVHDDSDPRDVGDEPALVRRSTGAPVFVAARRIDAARALTAAYPDVRVIVSDDGLQHLAMARDVEVCVFDDRGIGNGWLLPAGPLREPWSRACDLVLHTGARPAFAGFTARRSLAASAVSADGATVPIAALAGRPLIAVAGIAKPDSFFQMLRDQGLVPARCIALPDHHDFDDWARVAAADATVLCTEKDALKLWRRQPDALAVPLRFEPAPAFLAALDAKLSSLDGHQAS
ncbi:tetraacyldisaccharide 4'-kinase [Variovorax arabinosiphilus]|uniref:tetraacyldisaccharide 4'-kinase n=1 Tax=Variovorax arabinosiphilus TaxID=3053498 RepID=UPI002575DD9C|nr:MULTISPECIES: tetraacyldisaccharide 4'-kinase [unclassified Variovorax]MDM0118972.1 tetraacyldisaccharide 4'-kinase [Variovorax sp. J2L1-78]MDM0129398.1 tetraacyldisaccharide 4'-kinase [Variovorax sp. J2L1-63]MDM0232816.1 tetraacyldisaccharide 4'-kinase [Variovorax sp. J2R1-6]